MSRIYVCEFGKDKIICRRVFQEGCDTEANRYAQRRAGGMNSLILDEAIRDGVRIYQILSFQSKEGEGYFCIKNNKVLFLKRGDVVDSLKENLPPEVLAYISDLTGVKLLEYNIETNTEDDVDSQLPTA